MELLALEYPAILQRLATATETPLGEELALALTPSTDAGEVAHRQALTTEVIALFEASEEPPLAGIHDVREAAELAARAGALPPETLRRVAATIHGGLVAREAITTALLAELAAPIEPGLAPVAEQIDRGIEPDGSGLRDSASPELRRLRKQLREHQQRAAEELRRLPPPPSRAARPPARGGRRA